MSKLTWDQVGEREYETGVDQGVLYRPDDGGAYSEGYAWNGLTGVTESPSGAEATAQYADNIKYLNLVSVEEFGGTIEAFMYPDEFAECDGTIEPEPGVAVNQQTRKLFGLSYRTKVGNDVAGDDFGYKLHLVYGALAAPSEKAFATVNDTPAPINFSWQFSTTPVAVGVVGGVSYKPTSLLVIDSTRVNADALASLEQLLYGSDGADPSLPLPADVLALFSGTVTVISPTAPTYDNGTHTLTIPTQTGVVYYHDGVVIAAGTHTVTEDMVITARPTTGYEFADETVNEWFIDFS